MIQCACNDYGGGKMYESTLRKIAYAMGEKISSPSYQKTVFAVLAASRLADEEEYEKIKKRRARKDC